MWFNFTNNKSATPDPAPLINPPTPPNVGDVELGTFGLLDGLLGFVYEAISSPSEYPSPSESDLFGSVPNASSTSASSPSLSESVPVPVLP